MSHRDDEIYWKHIHDPRERKRVQDRLAQRRYRKLDGSAGIASQSTEDADIGIRTGKQNPPPKKSEIAAAIKLLKQDKHPGEGHASLAENSQMQDNGSIPPNHPALSNRTLAPKAPVSHEAIHQIYGNYTAQDQQIIPFETLRQPASANLPAYGHSVQYSVNAPAPGVRPTLSTADRYALTTIETVPEWMANNPLWQISNRPLAWAGQPQVGHSYGEAPTTLPVEDVGVMGGAYQAWRQTNVCDPWPGQFRVPEAALGLPSPVTTEQTSSPSGEGSHCACCRHYGEPPQDPSEKGKSQRKPIEEDLDVFQDCQELLGDLINEGSNLRVFRFGRHELSAAASEGHQSGAGKKRKWPGKVVVLCLDDDDDDDDGDDEAHE